VAKPNMVTPLSKQHGVGRGLRSLIAFLKSKLLHFDRIFIKY